MSISLSLKLNRSDLNDRHQFPQHQHQHQQKQQNRLLFASDDDGNDCDDNELPSLSSERSEIPAQPSSLSLSSSMAIKMNRSSEFNHHSNKSPRRRNLESEINKQLIRSLMPLSFQRSKSSVINQQQQQQSHYPHRHLNYLLKKRECLDNSMRYLFSFGDRRYSLIVQFILILEIFVSFNLIQLNSCDSILLNKKQQQYGHYHESRLSMKPSGSSLNLEKSPFQQQHKTKIRSRPLSLSLSSPSFAPASLTSTIQQQNYHFIDDDNVDNPISITNAKLAKIRFVRSFSEEFMSSSEERERGLQFFGGLSSGLGSSSSSLLSNGLGLTHKLASPYFDTESISTNVTISEGSRFVHLPCRVKQLVNRTLSWIRRQDVQILTVGTLTYTSDQRFKVIHIENSDDWSLMIDYPTKKDAGIYECQISTMPKMSLFIQLNVVVSKAKIIEGPTLYLSSGSILNLTCVVRDSPEPPDYIFWYHNGQVINYGSPRGIKVHTEKAKQTVSKLMIQKAQINDSGNYSCTPSNAEAAHIAVHIQNNANPAASIQHGKRSASREYGSNRAASTTNRLNNGYYRSEMMIASLNALFYYYYCNYYYGHQHQHHSYYYFHGSNT
ncbi:hypothetical protein SSS_09186 [Sarcoptes scabiei]|uniref:Ig-like domain-containing protein n=1 Tax=Sarcoptes scabiei TaxID=52283 RepID=A0A834RAB7_SARSC|nr:hypothetical protein SSS_09186 [Sarcoptes scabiei]